MHSIQRNINIEKGQIHPKLAMTTYFFFLLFYRQITDALPGRNQEGSHKRHLLSIRGK